MNSRILSDMVTSRTDNLKKFPRKLTYIRIILERVEIRTVDDSFINSAYNLTDLVHRMYLNSLASGR